MYAHLFLYTRIHIYVYIYVSMYNIIILNAIK